jgi:Gram-negative bacterial TonB protein C-terminal
VSRRSSFISLTLVVARVSVVLLLVSMLLLSAQEARKVLTRVAPVYPPTAKSMRISGEVHVDATVAADGHVESTKATSGEDHTSAAITHSTDQGWWFTIVIGVLGLSGGVVIAWLMIASINKTLHQAIFELSEGAEQIASAATQVSSSSQSLAEGSSQQATSIQGTSASTAQVNSMARRATANSQSTAEMVSQSQEKFQATNHRLEQMVVAMDGIGDSSSKIARLSRSSTRSRSKQTSSR